MKLFRAGSVLIATLVGGFAGCGSDSGSSTANIRFFNGLAGESYREVSINDGGRQEVAFAEMTEFENRDPGTVTVALENPDSASPLAEESFSGAEGSDYTVFVTGTDDEPELVVAKHSYEDPGPNDFRARVVHLASNVNPVDVYIVKDDPEVGVFPAFEADARFKQVNPYREANVGQYDVIITGKDSIDPIAALRSFRFEEGSSYVIVLLESVGGGAPYSVEAYRED